MMIRDSVCSVCGSNREHHSMNCPLSEWKCWRNAGELYGRVKKGLGFGDLGMYEMLDSIDGFRLQWWFNADGARYSKSYAITCRKLMECQSIELIAVDITENMKRDARAVLSRNDLPNKGS